jgi:hypothetical protein
MKKLKALIALGGLSALLWTSLAMAQTTTLDITTILPSDIDLFYQLNSSEKNPLESFILDSFKQEATYNSELNTQQITDLVTKLIENNTLSFAIKIPAQTGTTTVLVPRMYVAFNINDQDFTNLKNLSEPDAQEETYKNFTIYIGKNESYVVHLENLFIMTSHKEDLTQLIDNYINKSTDTLASQSSFKEVMAHNVTNNFFNMYINPTAILEQPEFSQLPSAEILKGLNQNMIKAILAESFALTQTDNGFKVSLAVKSDKTKLTELGLNYFDKYNFVPDLYKEISGKDLIFYEEKNNTTERVKELFKTLNLDSTALDELNKVKTEFKAESGVSIDTDVLPLLTGRSLTTIHKTNQIYPAFTMIFEVSDKSKAGYTLTKIADYLKKTLQKQQTDMGKDIFTYSTETAGGTAFYTFILDIAAITNDASLKQYGADKTKLFIRMAVTEDGLLVISNHPDLNSIFRYNTKGLMDNTEFSTAFPSLNETIESICYFNVNTLRLYLGEFLTTLEAPSDSINVVNSFLVPWHDLYGKSYSNTDTIWANGIVNVDVSGLESYAQLFQNLFTSYQTYDLPDYSIPTELNPLKPTFCDVHENDWHYQYINSLSSRGIIKGYSDGCFRPDQPITRAEFITLVMKGTGKAAAINSQYQPFKDVPPIYGEWYSENVNMAAMMGFVSGYSDGTFRPNANITRAEALQILCQVDTTHCGLSINTTNQPIESLNTFNDVNENDWFFAAIVSAKYNHLADGVSSTKFEPNRNLTRAEATKIISNFMDLEGTIENPMEYAPHDLTQ